MTTEFDLEPHLGDAAADHAVRVDTVHAAGNFLMANERRSPDASYPAVAALPFRSRPPVMLQEEAITDAVVREQLEIAAKEYDEIADQLSADDGPAELKS